MEIFSSGHLKRVLFSKIIRSNPKNSCLMKHPHKIALTFFLSLIFLGSCNSGTYGPSAEEKSKDAESGELKEAFDAAPVEQTTAISVGAASNASTTYTVVMDDKATATSENVFQSSVKIPEKIKKTADINLTVDDYKTARAAIEKIVHAQGAYISGENEQNNTYSISNNMIIRVANKNFDATVTNITAIDAHVNSKNIYTEDVTAQFIDITARLKSKKEVEKRYLDLLQKAGKVTEILEVEQNLRVIREEIEAKEGELKYLNDQVDYSTINLTLHQDYEYTPEDRPGFFGRMGTAFGNGWNGFLSFVVGIMSAWPLWIILSIGGYFLYKFIKRQAKK
jgi:hypothetical protein